MKWAPEGLSRFRYARWYWDCTNDSMRTVLCTRFKINVPFSCFSQLCPLFSQWPWCKGMSGFGPFTFHTHHDRADGKVQHTTYVTPIKKDVHEQVFLLCDNNKFVWCFTWTVFLTLCWSYCCFLNGILFLFNWSTYCSCPYRVHTVAWRMQTSGKYYFFITLIAPWTLTLLYTIGWKVQLV